MRKLVFVVLLIATIPLMGGCTQGKVSASEDADRTPSEGGTSSGNAP